MLIELNDKERAFIKAHCYDEIKQLDEEKAFLNANPQYNSVNNQLELEEETAFITSLLDKLKEVDTNASEKV